MYKKELSKLLSKHGRVREWAREQLGMKRTTFERKVRQDTLTPEEKECLHSIIINGKKTEVVCQD